MSQLHWIVVGEKGCRRTACAVAALRKRSCTIAYQIDYHQLIDGSVRLQDLVNDRSVVRIDSMVESTRLRQSVMELGREDAEAEGSPVASIAELQFERDQGNYCHPLWGRQIYLGMIRLLNALFAGCDPSAFWVHSPPDIPLLYDKYKCQKRLLRRGIPIPEILGQPKNYEELRAISRSHPRIMLKASHGSGGAGCVAIHTHRGILRGFTPLRYFQRGQIEWLYCGQSTRCIRDERELARIVNRLCRECCHAEEWLPKARIGSGSFDVRVVTIGGEVTHQVARLSKGPMTNLNLGNRRIQMTELHQQLPWYNELSNQSIVNVCTDVAKNFPKMVTLGMDVVVRSNRTIAVLEANAFGGLLPGTEHQGMSTYEMEVEFIIQSRRAQHARMGEIAKK